MHRYQGGGLDGRNSSKLLCKLDLLQLELPINLHPVLKTLNIFSGVVEGCFSYELCTNYKEKIMDFRDSYKNLMVYSKKSLKFPLSVTWKVNSVTAHLEDMLTKQGKGMAHFAEQTGEAAYHEMKPADTAGLKITKNHGLTQLTAVTKFASWNLKDVKQLTRKDLK